MFRRIKVNSALLGFRYKSFKLTQIESTKISKADKVKKLHYENKYLYGSKIKTAKGSNKEVKQTNEPVDQNDISSEIYWQCIHVPKIPDLSSVKKKVKTKSNAADDTLSKPKNRNNKNKTEKNLSDKWTEEDSKSLQNTKSPKQPKSNSLSATKQPKLPDSLSKLQTNLQEVKVYIKKTLDEDLKVPPTAQDDEEIEERDIPFENNQLRAIPNFPLFLDGKNIIEPFYENLNSDKSYFIPSVSKILQATMPESQRLALIQWKNLKISELGFEGFQLMQQSHLNRGKMFHEYLHKHFSGETVVKSEISSEVLEIWNSVEPYLEMFQTPGVITEEHVKHPQLHYKGIVDCVSFHNSTLSVIEWKKSDRQKKTINFTYDAPVQLCSYLGALNASRGEFLENPIKHGVIVVAYNDGQKANLFELKEADLKKYWKIWLTRLQEYWVRYKDNTLPDPV
ncbi:CLUMA_CG016175, isoform A [Clunio marinus]|uniref:Mitochondrial genome maintenance exonuclease 1 n=1 Tax=Clunio marinus TaxID=568069 RepID=A0A1J1IXT2_9DIPT|nr:CLUMA_CG016175, isoform A [Clunio marinus]